MNNLNEPDSGVQLSTRGPVGVLTLHRPATLNALSLDMIQALNTGLRTLEADNDIHMILLCSADARAFCAGGDMKQIRQHVLDDDHAAIERYFMHEYSLDLNIARCRKPYLSLIDGIAMGGGLGISVNGRFRVVTENARLAMPESRIGFFPDVGASWFLPRLPQRCGYWLGLSAMSVTGAEAVQTGLATHYLPADDLPELQNSLQATLQDAAPRDTDQAARIVQDTLDAAVSASSGHDNQQQERFARTLSQREAWFADDDLDAILQRLQQAQDSSQDARELLKQLDSASPWSLHNTLALFRQAEGLALEDCLQLELQLALEACRYPDLAEGVRAVLVDKDRQPQWAELTAA